MIESYSFGFIRVDGEDYRSDVIIYPDHVDDSWWREEGHSLHIDDLTDIVAQRPEVLVVGTGDSELLRVPPQTANYLESKGVELIVERTHDACNTYNNLCKSRKVIAALHLTC